MKIIMFYHSLRSDWNHGNAHFLRGVATELIRRGHEVTVYEPFDSWSLSNLIDQHGTEAADEYRKYYPLLKSERYLKNEIDPETVLDGADLVIVHEWNDHKTVRQIGEVKKKGGAFTLLFHDTHHRSVSDPGSMSEYDLSNYDGVLAYGKVIKDIYLRNGWTDKAWVWHEAADINVFHPYENVNKENDIVWIGNWGDDERTSEISEYFIRPSGELKLKAEVYGVRYPEHAAAALKQAGIKYCGWLPNYKVPGVFAASRMTVHIPRRPYVEQLPGIPTIRPFEALACGIPLVSAPWKDDEGLFRKETDYLQAENRREMKEMIRAVLNDEGLARSLAQSGIETICKRHTCAHRTEELLVIAEELKTEGKAKKKKITA